MSELGEDVRERSPLHEAAREWPREEGRRVGEAEGRRAGEADMKGEARDRFRIRVKRNLSCRPAQVKNDKCKEDKIESDDAAPLIKPCRDPVHL